MINAHTRGHGLKKDTRGGFAKRNGRRKNNECDDEGNARVDVKAPFVVRQPDNKGGNDHTNVSEGVSHNMEEDTPHVEVVTVTLLMVLRLGLSMVVRFVDIFIAVVVDLSRSSLLVGIVGSSIAVTQKT
jgi:hypothetical protein